MKIFSALFATALLLSAAPASYSAVQADASKPIKTYTLVDLKPVITNSAKCDACLQDLQPLTKAPFSLQFTKHEEEGKHSVAHLSGLVGDHTHTTVMQTVSGNIVHRIGVGTFAINGKKVDYMAMFSADLDNPSHSYLYPITLAFENGHCSYTALLKPSEETVAAFKKNVRSGAVAQGLDLHTH